MMDVLINMMKISKNSLSIFILGFLFTTGVFAQNNKSLKLWYKQPAQKWSSEALPIGNGRMGAMFYGGVHQEKIQFNEQSLWSGDNNWDGEYETGDRGFGSYRNFGEITIDFAKAKEATAYSRSLDISNGIHQTAFIQNGIQYKRDAFASYPDQVLVFRYTATEKGAFCGKISLTSAQGAISKANQNSIHFEGVMANKLKYAAVLRIQHQGGKIKVEGNNISFENCNSLTLLLDARTNYKADFKSDWRGNDPLPLIEKELASAQSKSYKSLLKNHVADLSGLLGRASINIGTTDAAVLTLPTDERLKRYAGESVVTETKDGLKNKIQKGGEDPDLEEIMFQYGRYLLASSSRPGGLPANLQGLWNDSNTPAWASDYHNNINLQMNYWSAESTNLSECQLPLLILL